MRVKNIEFNTTTLDIIVKLKNEFNHRGINLLKDVKKIQDYYLVTCPYHKNGQENNPSAQFRIEDGFFYCHRCKQAHSIDEVISYCLGENGLNWLLNNFSSIEIENRNVKLNLNNKKQESKFIPNSVLSQFRYIHPYIYKRKISLEVVRKFDIGYDKSTDCITFPNKDINGNILFIARRSVKSKYFNYPRGINKPLYGIYELRREAKHKNINEIYIVESMIDALTIWSWGRYAIALNGVGSFYQIEELKKLPYRTFILATDNDEAGKKAREKIRKNIKNKLIKEIDYNCYKDCKDINDMTKEQFLSANILF